MTVTKTKRKGEEIKKSSVFSATTTVCYDISKVHKLIEKKRP